MSYIELMDYIELWLSGKYNFLREGKIIYVNPLNHINIKFAPLYDVEISEYNGKVLIHDNVFRNEVEVDINDPDSFSILKATIHDILKNR